MARTSFPSAVTDYLDAMQAYLVEGTLRRKRRNLRVIFEDMKARAAASSRESVRGKPPVLIREGDIEALLLRWKGRGLDPATQAKYLSDLDGFLAWCDNPVITKMRKTRHVRFPRAMAKTIRVLDDSELERLRIAAEGIEGWPGSVARLIVALLPMSALRRKELRLATVGDVDVARGRILVGHPKGEDAWAVPDFAPLPVAIRPTVEDFLAERRTYLDGAGCEWLVPYRRVNGEIGPWSDAMLGQLKGLLEARSGVRFSLKTFRATFAQIAKDRGASIEAVSRALRHRTTKTTETFYARIRADDAFHEIEKALARPVRIERRTNLAENGHVTET